MTYFVVDNFGHGLDARKHILNLPPGALYSATNVSINRGGEPEAAKAFVSKGDLPAGQTFGLLSAGAKLYTFGSLAPMPVPDGMNYQQLSHPNGSAMTAMVYGCVVKGKPFVIASFVTGYGVFYNGLFIQDWLPPSGTLTVVRSGPAPAPLTTLADLATNFAGQINASAIYTATASGNVVTVTGRPNLSFTVDASVINGGTSLDQSIYAATVQAAASGGSEVLAYGTVSVSGVEPEYNEDNGQYFSVLVCNSVKVNGVEVMNVPVYAMDDGSAAAGIAQHINGYTSNPEYTARASGSTVFLTAMPGTGAGPNGFVVSVDNGSNNVAQGAPFGHGAPVGVQSSQITQFTLFGTYEPQDSWAITLNGVVYTIAGFIPPPADVGGDGGGTGTTPPDTGGGGGDGGGAPTGGNATPGNVSGQRPIMALTKNSKTYAIAGPNLFGSMIGDCTQWNAGTGTFITDMSSELAGAEILTAIAFFQGNLAIFSRSTIQIYFVDPDPSNNEQLQALQNIGTPAGRTVTSFGDTDTFFLADSGVRSLKVRAATDSATQSDIGSPVDKLIIAAILAAGESIGNAVAVMDPVDGRYLLQIGTTTFVFSYFPDAKVGGWTTWESGLAITDFAVIETKLFARAGDTVYLLGGDNNDQYTQQIMDIKLPFLSARQIATLKHFTALDVACDGIFDVSIATDPTRPDEEEIIATLDGSTYGFGIDPFFGEDVTAIALHFVGRPGVYGRLANVAIHYQPLEENA